MKKKIFLLLATILMINSYSQIEFEKGYYINNSNQKIDCLIKNIDWKNNPVSFDYKLLDKKEIKNINIKSVKEFSINNISKYLRKVVNIDRSSENINNLSSDKKPLFKKEQLFLKVLLEGKASLYLYQESNLKRYFYKKENFNIEQLVYKIYKTPNDKIGKNNQFKQQIVNNLKCSAIKIDRIKILEYKKRDLIKFFIEYNKCNNSEFVNFEKKQKRDLINLNLRPRIINSSLSIQNSTTDFGKTNFEKNAGIGFGIGIELEYIFPFNKNKWAISIEPTYHNFNSKKTTDLDDIFGGELTGEVNYNSIEMPISLRHYFFLNKKSKIFANISYIFDFSPQSSIEFTRSNGSNVNSLEIESQNNLGFGVGYKKNDKYSLEIRYQTNKDLLRYYPYWNSDYKNFSIILGYSLF